MRISNQEVVSTSPTPLVVLTTFNSKALWLGHIANYAIQLVFSAASCTFKLQGSCDAGDAQGQSQAEYEAKITNWSDIAGSSTAVSTPGNILYNIQDCGYNWVRVVITGTATVTSARINVKGV